MSERFQLAIESSGARASVALARARETVFSAEVEAGHRQSEVLMEPLREALALVKGHEIGLVLLGTGPGSYNGARVGIAAGQGVAIVHTCPAVGICSLEALVPVRTGDPCLAVGDARRGSFFTLMLCDGKLSGDLELLEQDELVERVRAAAEAGESVVTLEDPMRLKLPDGLAGKIELAAPSAGRVLEAWWEKPEAEREKLKKIPPEPFYLRPPHITEPGRRGIESGAPGG